MLLIPVIENAFKHSGLGIDDHAYVNFSITEVEGKLQVVAENSIMPNYFQEQPGGIGLNNIHKRLDMAYPGSYELDIAKTDTAFTLKLIVPLL